MNSKFKNALLVATLPAVVLTAFLPRVLAQAPPAAGPAGAQANRPRSTTGSQGPLPEHAKFSAQQIEAGSSLFVQNCAFCHGRDAAGGETGPDLTHSKLVSSDKNGEAIGPVIRNGRPEKGMPRFNQSEPEIVELVAFIHKQQDDALSESGNRRGVLEADLHTGNAEMGKKYFDGSGGCTKCHSATGDLAGVVSRFNGLALEMQMLYPRNAKKKVTVTTSSGQHYSGILDLQDEFTVGMTDGTGTYRSWPVTAITYKVDNALDAHIDAMTKYTDDDIHNVLAYIQTLK